VHRLRTHVRDEPVHDPNRSPHGFVELRPREPLDLVHRSRAWILLEEIERAQELDWRYDSVQACLVQSGHYFLRQPKKGLECPRRLLEELAEQRDEVELDRHDGNALRRSNVVQRAILRLWTGYEMRSNKWWSGRLTDFWRPNFRTLARDTFGLTRRQSHLISEINR
jgi:hypothetical protein